MNFKNVHFKNIIIQNYISFKRFPITIILSAISMIFNINYFTQMIHHTTPSKLATDLFQLNPFLYIGIVFSLVIHLLLEQYNKKKFLILSTLISLLFLLIIFFSLKESESYSYFLKTIQLTIGISLLISFIPFFCKNKNICFYNYNRIILNRFITSIFYSSILFLGTFLSTVLIYFLFDLNSNFLAYAFEFLFFICYNFIQILFFINGIPKKEDLLHLNDTCKMSLKTIVYNILVPLTLLYIFIIYLYAFKIIIMWTLPKGYLGWTISSLNFLGIFCMIMLHPNRGKHKLRWVQFFEKYYYIINLPLLGMLFLGIFTRINDYGMTEFRYFLIVLSIWSTFISIFYIVSRSEQIKIIPISLSVLLIFTTFGPWSAYQVSLNSQLKVFKEIAEKNGFLVGNQIQTLDNTIPSSEKIKIISVLRYIINYHGIKSLSGTINEKQLESTLKSKTNHSNYFLQEYGLIEKEK